MGLGRFELPTSRLSGASVWDRITARNRINPYWAARSAVLAYIGCRKLPGFNSGNNSGNSGKKSGSLTLPCIRSCTEHCTGLSGLGIWRCLIQGSPASIAQEVRWWSIGSARNRGRFSLLSSIPENDVADELAENI